MTRSRSNAIFSRANRSKILLGVFILCASLLSQTHLKAQEYSQIDAILNEAPEPNDELVAALAEANSPNATGLSVNTNSRAAVVQFYNQFYRMSAPPEMAWQGSSTACRAGDTSAEYKAAVIQRVNFFRAMAGVPGDVQVDPNYSASAQQAALVMSANNHLSHTPTNAWQCYSDAARTGAGSSNIALASYGWQAIDLYIKDPGGNNIPVGHRRWIFHPPTKFMGTGDIPANNGKRASNALWVFDSNIFGTHPPLRDPANFVAWPPRGYVPSHLVYPRWSFSYNKADFSYTSVSMKNAQGQPISLKRHPPTTNSSLNTLVWEPVIDESLIGYSKPSSDYAIDVTLTNVLIDGKYQNFSYRTILIAVNGEPQGLTLSGENVYENQPPNSLVGRLNSTDPEGQALTYRLVSGEGDKDNHLFAIQGRELRTLQALDYESQANYSVRVRVSDGTSDGHLTQIVRFSILNANDPPHDITLTASSLNENQASGSVAGTLTAHDQDSGDSHSFSLVSDAGDSDNAFFFIQGNTIYTRGPLDYEHKSSYKIRVEASDQHKARFSKSLTITINDRNDLPSLSVLPAYFVPLDGTFTLDFRAYDQDHDALLTISAPDLPAWLQLQDHGNGRFSLNGDSNGISAQELSISVIVSDQHGATIEKPILLQVGKSKIYLPSIRK